MVDYSTSKDFECLEEDNYEEPTMEEAEEPKQCKEYVTLEEEGLKNPTEGNDDDT